MGRPDHHSTARPTADGRAFAGVAGVAAVGGVLVFDHVLAVVAGAARTLSALTTANLHLVEALLVLAAAAAACWLSRHRSADARATVGPALSGLTLVGAFVVLTAVGPGFEGRPLLALAVAVVGLAAAAMVYTTAAWTAASTTSTLEALLVGTPALFGPVAVPWLALFGDGTYWHAAPVGAVGVLPLLLVATLVHGAVRGAILRAFATHGVAATPEADGDAGNDDRSAA
jgi:hypothetical protein